MLLPEIHLIEEDDVDRPAVGHRTSPVPARPRRKGRRRAAFAATAVAALAVTSLGSAAYAAGTFSDVSPDNPFAGAISWMANNGITSGYPDGTFKPNNSVDRKSMAAFFANYNATITTHSNTNMNALSANYWLKSVNCPEGKRPIGGGGGASGAAGTTIYITHSFPTDSGWTVRFATQNNAYMSNVTTTVHVTCMPMNNGQGLPD